MRGITKDVPGIFNPEVKELKIDKIKTWVKNYRKREKITATSGLKFELSCEAFGEGHNLLRQLILTIDGDGSWKELDEDQNGNIIDLVLKEIESGRWS